MTATFANTAWNAAAPAAQASPWRFGRVVELPTSEGLRPALQWVLKRNCSITPRQLLVVYASLCLLALAISTGFWWHGARVVSAFAVVELLLVGVALVVYGRHAGDREVLTLQGRSLAVEHANGTRIEQAEFPADWLSVEPVAGQGSLVELSARGQSMRVGRFLRPEVRGLFAQELRRAARRASTPEHETGFELK